MKKVKKNRDHKLVAWTEEGKYNAALQFAEDNNDISLSKAIDQLVTESLMRHGYIN